MIDYANQATPGSSEWGPMKILAWGASALGFTSFRFLVTISFLFPHVTLAAALIAREPTLATKLLS